ncbi:MAG: DUF4266 domain-containing protein [Vicinamibacterales bacterium]
MSLMTKRLVAVLILAGGAATSACATVQPWQRGRLANPCMIFDANGALVAFQTHWQDSREGSTGGFGVQGGGCACK